MSDRFFVLDGHDVAPATLHEWALWMENAGATRVVANTRMTGRQGVEIVVSTGFLGLDHRFAGDDGPPLLFETIVFGGKLDGGMERYPTWADAEAGHAAMRVLVTEADDASPVIGLPASDGADR